MVWRETFPPANELALDAEAEQERRLAAQARAGADWALTALIARYQPTVTRYLTRLCGDQGHARKLAERVFQRMERRLHGPHGADNLRLWLLRASTEAGLEALRRPKRAQAPLLGATRVAGLLSAESDSGPQRALRGGIKRLRNVVGAVSRQARPLVWQDTDTTSPPPGANGAEQAREAVRPGPVDETLDTLDPREALRHRLVRLTLADLPYGDAQCLALHLVAGLNQAEVARALGITGSAARKRIVQGLSQFSAHYQEAVQSLGLPEELGYGDTLPQPVEAEDVIAAPEPVIVPEMPEELAPNLPQPAPVTLPLAVDALEDEDEAPSGVTYYAGESPEESSAYHAPVEPDGEAEFDSSPAGFDPDYAATSALYAEPFTSAPRIATMAMDDQEMVGDAEDVEDEEVVDLDGQGSSSAGAGSVTRIAADAIVGPVVDALPVHSEPLALAPGLGSPSSRSTPLMYELASGEAEPGGITMNWMDSTGMMAPLSFEAIVTPTTLDAELEDGDDPWARSTILELETPAEPGGASALTVAAEEDSAPPAIAVKASDTPAPPLDISIALDEGDYGWERSHQDGGFDYSGASLAYEALPLAGQAPGVVFNEPAPDRVSEQANTDAQPAPPVTQTLEDLWDETPDTFER